MKRRIIILTIFALVLLAFTGCMSASHLGHGGDGTSYQSDSHSSHQSGGGSHSGGCH